MPANRHAEAVQAAISGMAGTLAIARALVQSGRQVDLAGLDQEAATLAAAIMALPPGDARLLIPDLDALARQVGALAEDLPSPG
jgi:hypothetical protein